MRTLIQTIILLSFSTALFGQTQTPSVLRVGFPGIKCDGTTDDAPAINAATLAYRNTGVLGYFSKVTLTFPTGQKSCAIGSPVLAYSGEYIEGYGATLTALPGFSGAYLIGLANDTSSFYINGQINGLNFDDRAAGGGLVAIQALAADVVDSTFSNLQFETSYGVECTTYCQQNNFTNYLTQGALENMLTVYGNFNTIDNLDKEGNSGTLTGCYIQVGNFGTATTTDNNIFHHILIEGGGNANKTAICVTNALYTEFHDIWMEIVPLNGTAVNLNTTQNTRFYERFLYLNPTDHIVNLTASTNVYFEQMDSSGPPYDIYTAIVADSTSTYSINRGLTRFNSDIYPFSALSKGSGMSTSYATSTEPTGFSHVSQQRDQSAQNLLVNGAFESGEYNFTWSSTTNLNHNLVSSQFDSGQMEQVSTNATINTNYTLYQNIVVPSSWVGRMMTFSAQISISGSGTEFATPFISGAGLSSSNSFNAFKVGNTGLIQIQFTPQSAGTMSVGVNLFALNANTSSLVTLDDYNLSFGSVGMNYSASFGSLELNKVLQTYAAAQPSTGTWALGSIVWNSNPVTNAGWICIGAGSPGTWTTIPLVLPADFPMVLSSPNNLTGFTTAQSPTLFYTTTGSGLYRISVAIYVTVAATGGSSPTIQAQLWVPGGLSCQGQAFGANTASGSTGAVTNCTTVTFLPAGLPISWASVFGGSAGTPPTYSIYPTVEQIH